ncbi:MAG: hypothetical protein VR72_17770 [Clostridiaceae bacterium BRH_c20a]|nr:MAG: hypothetical protein VR72_17770 [Clostridiaceae bacterium BRH_c20a]
MYKKRSLFLFILIISLISVGCSNSTAKYRNEGSYSSGSGSKSYSNSYTQQINILNTRVETTPNKDILYIVGELKNYSSATLMGSINIPFYDKNGSIITVGSGLFTDLLPGQTKSFRGSAKVPSGIYDSYRVEICTATPKD